MKKEKTASIAEKFVYETNAIFPPFCDLRIRKAGAYQRLLTSKYFLRSMRKQNAHLAPVVQRLDNAIHRINRYPADKCQQNKPRYPLDSDLSGG